MKARKLTLLTFLFAGLLAYVSCRKTDSLRQENELTPTSLEEKFFNSHRTADPSEKALVDFVKAKNDKLHFVEKTVSKVGFPRWDKALIKNNSHVNGRGTSDSTTITYVPFVRDSQNFVNSSMIIRTSASDTSFSYVCDWQYSRLQNNITAISDSAEYFSIFFMALDKNVFGHTKFMIVDTTLFQYTNHKAVYLTLNTPNSSGRSNLFADVCENVIISFEDCTYQNTPECSSGCDHCSLCMGSISYQYCWKEWVDGGGGGSGGDTGGGTGGGGGSGGDGTPPNCDGLIGGRTMVRQECGPGWEPGDDGEAPEDPCVTASAGANHATTLSKVQKFLDAKAQIQAADPATEHAIGFGRDAANGNALTTSSMANGNGNHGSVPAIPGGFADMHNHPGNTEPSAADLYSLIQKNTPTNGYNTRFVIAGGTMYAFLITNPALADKFATKYPKEQIGNNPPDFPSPIFDEYKNASLWLQGNLGYSSTLAEALGMAFIFEKNNAGVAVLRQDANGNFKILRVKQTSTSGTLGTYEDITCN